MTLSSQHITIFGAGSIGCYLGGQLASAGANIHFIGRERYQKQLTTLGLTLTHYARKSLRIEPENIVFNTELHDSGDSDLVLVTVKSQDTEEAGRILAGVLQKNTLIISFQNGVGNADLLRRVMPGFVVLGAMVPFNVTGTGPGQFHCGTEGDLYIEAHSSEKLSQLQQNFTRSGQGCFLSQNIVAVQWGKLLVNLNNALNTLSGNTLYAGLAQREYRQALALMIEEALLIAHNAGIKPEKFGKATPEKMIKILRLPNLLYRLIMNSVVRIDKNARSSMLDDLESGRTTEIEFLQGEIVRLATNTGQLAPINERVMHTVNEAFAVGKSPNMTGSEILQLVQMKTNQL